MTFNLTVAQNFVVRRTPGSLNVLVARLLVPGGPWPGHYGLEAVAFAAREAMMPSWFPQRGTDHQLVTFAETMAVSAAFQQGHGTVIFPELLAVSERPRAQGFGIVLVDRLARLYIDHVVPPARALGWLGPQGEHRPSELREIAFHAHEWGHRAVDDSYTTSVTRHHRRLLAVVSEITADLTALDMLLGASHTLAPEVARTLILDRVLRDAWLPRPYAHVASIVGRHLLQFLSRVGVISDGPYGPLLDLEPAAAALASELTRIDDVYRAGNRGDDDAMVRYLVGYGWSVKNGRGMTLASPEPIVEQLKELAHLPKHH